VKTPWPPVRGGLSYGHEYIITHGGAAPVVRRRRVLSGRTLIGGSGLGLILLICIVIYLAGGFRTTKS